MPSHSLAAAMPQPDFALSDADVETQTPAASIPHAYVPPVHSSRLLIGAVAVSGSLHVAAAAALLIARTTLPETGVLQTPTEAISLEQHQTIVLESVVSTPVKAAAASSAAMPQGAVQPEEATPERVIPVKPRVIEKNAPPPRIMAAEARPEVVDVTEEPLQVIEGGGKPDAAVNVKSRPDETKTEERQERRKPHKQPEPKKAERKPVAKKTAGGATSRANASGAKSAGRASASRGSVIQYAARVRAKVARNKPSGRGHRGVTRVSFAVSLSGGLQFARISRSSGSSALDSAALSAVRRAAPFGPPPAGTSPSQLRFSIPFYFR